MFAKSRRLGTGLCSPVFGIETLKSRFTSEDKSFRLNLVGNLWKSKVCIELGLFEVRKTWRVILNKWRSIRASTLALRVHTVYILWTSGYSLIYSIALLKPDSGLFILILFRLEKRIYRDYNQFFRRRSRLLPGRMHRWSSWLIRIKRLEMGSWLGQAAWLNQVSF